MITGRQIRAARALLDISQDELAVAAGLTKQGISKIEDGSVQPRVGTLADITRVFTDQGVEFIRDVGVQWMEHQVRTLNGKEGLKSFFLDVRSTMHIDHQEIVICGIDEEYLERKLGDFVNEQREEMAKIDHLRMRCLVEENDIDLGASLYCKYRWQAKENFSNVPFYIYGDKMAIIVATAQEDPLILLIHNRTIANAYRRQFDAMWASAKEPILS